MGPLQFNLFFNDIVTIKCGGRAFLADDGMFKITNTGSLFDRLILRYLRLIIDNKISFNLRINHIHNKLSRGCGVIFGLKHFFLFFYY